MSRKLFALTETEKAILHFLWDYGKPLTASEIVNLYPSRNWKASYIHLLLQSMLKKEVIRVEGFKPTVKNYARTFSPAISEEAFLVHEIVRNLHLKKEHVRKLLIYLIDSAPNLETINSMLEQCKEKKKQLS